MAVAVAQVVPQNVEKLPLFHWRPGSRALVIGSRDGARFDGHDDDDRGSYRRPLDLALLQTALARSGCEAVAAAWGNSLQASAGLALLQQTERPLIVIGSGHGDPQLVADLAPRVAAWLLLVDDQAGPAAAAIIEAGAHVEILWGVAEDLQPPPLAWERVRAVHITNRRLADPSDRFATARARLPAAMAVYDARHPHSLCAACGETLIWRSGGRSRLDALDALDPHDAVCRRCRTPAAGFTLT